MRRPLAVALAVAIAAVASGCSLSGSSSSNDDSDRRTAALECLRVSDVDARFEGEDWIQVEQPPAGPRIRFFLTSGEAESEQFTGEAEGAEQIGPTLLFVREGSDELLGKIEGCLDSL